MYIHETKLAATENIEWVSWIMDGARRNSVPVGVAELDASYVSYVSYVSC